MYEEIKQKIINVCLQLVDQELIYDTAGNISVRIPEMNHIIMTPSNVLYDSMKISDLPVLDLSGKIVEPGLKPTSETPMHLAVLNAFPQINAVIHTHSKYASAFSIIRQPIDTIYLLSLMVGFVPVAEYGTSGSEELAQHAVNALKQHDARACLLANHGALITAKNLDLAKDTARYLEKTAELQHIALCHGKPFEIPQSEIEAFTKAFVL